MIVDRILKTHPREVLIIQPDDTVAAVARLFEQKRSGIALVCVEADRLIGVVSLGDVVHALADRGAGVLDVPVNEIMTRTVVTCEPSENIETALNKMSEKRIRHLPVVENGRLKGFIEKPAALETLYEEAALDFSQLRSYVFKSGDAF
jgi:CBS domain-containing protein